MTAARPDRMPRTERGPFSWRFDVRSLKGEPRDISVEATPEECAAVARSIALPAVTGLKAHFRLQPRAGGCVDLRGRVEAGVTQICVVSLEPFDSLIAQPVELSFAPSAEPVPEPRGRTGRGLRHGEAAVLPPPSVGGNDDQEDPPDPMIDDTIDLGAVAVEFAVLALDPYPRKPGVHFDDMVVGDKDEPEPSAFAALARLKEQS